MYKRGRRPQTAASQRDVITTACLTDEFRGCVCSRWRLGVEPNTRIFRRVEHLVVGYFVAACKVWTLQKYDDDPVHHCTKNTAAALENPKIFRSKCRDS